MDLGLKNKVVLITGVNNPQGIGAATALAFAREGAKLVIVYKRIPHAYDECKTSVNGLDRYFQANGGDASAVVAELKSLHADCLAIESDISQENCVHDIFDNAMRRFGQVDILVNNAAVSDENGCDTICTIDRNVVDDTFAVNVTGAILMMRSFIKQCGNFGRIINLSTDAAQTFAGQIAYGASKAALEALTRSIAIEVGESGITVNCVSPGPTQTGYISEALENAVLPDIPLGRLIQPQDIADAIVFLASECAAMITGQVIKVSGGHAL